jgi:hypothetical protein
MEVEQEEIMQEAVAQAVLQVVEILTFLEVKVVEY